jgi:hypothetical protein
MLKVTGLEELQRELNDMARRAEDLSGTHSVPISELLTPDFLLQCSRFHSLDEMFEASCFKTESEADFAAIPDAAWDEFIRANTSFANWEAMQGEAASAWAARRLSGAAAAA